MRNAKVKAMKIAAYSIISILLVIFFIKIAYPGIYNFGEDVIYSRFTLGDSSIEAPISSDNYTLRLINILEGFQRDDRTKIHENALEISRMTNYTGIGLGNFLDGLYRIGATMKYSNAHNLYYTLLSEGGILFLIVFLFLMISILKKAFIYDKRVFISIVIFLFYGLFSGQIYESTSFRSCIDYFYIIFLLAYLKNKQINANQAF